MNIDERVLILERQVAALTLRVAELAGGNPKKTSTHVPKYVLDAFAKHGTSLNGRLSAAEIAAALQLPSAHETLIAIGRHLKNIGATRIRTAQGRFYLFGDAKPPADGEAGVVVESRAPEWMIALMEERGQSLAGIVAVRDVACSLGLPTQPHVLERLAKHLRLMGIRDAGGDCFAFER